MCPYPLKGDYFLIFFRWAKVADLGGFHNSKTDVINPKTVENKIYDEIIPVDL